MLPQPAVWLELTRGQIPGGVDPALLPFRNQVIAICAHGWFRGAKAAAFIEKHNLGSISSVVLRVA